MKDLPKVFYGQTAPMRFDTRGLRSMDDETKPMISGRGIGIYHFIRDSLLWGWLVMLMFILIGLSFTPPTEFLQAMMWVGFIEGFLLGAIMSMPRLDEGRYD